MNKSELMAAMAICNQQGGCTACPCNGGDQASGEACDMICDLGGKGREALLSILTADEHETETRRNEERAYSLRLAEELSRAQAEVAKLKELLEKEKAINKEYVDELDQAMQTEKQWDKLDAVVDAIADRIRDSHNGVDYSESRNENGYHAVTISIRPERE